MTGLHLSHFTAAIIFAFFASIVFGITQKNTTREMVRYGVQCFAFFVVGTALAAWLMAGLHYLATR
jgi:lipopolysaccharide export LptBFGC system permease protein LptF